MSPKRTSLWWAAAWLLATVASCAPPVVDKPGGEIVLDRAWQVPLGYDPLNEPILEGDTFFVAETWGAAAVDLATGKLKWRSSLPDDFETVGGVYSWDAYLVIPGAKPNGQFQYFADRLGYWNKDGTFLGVEKFSGTRHLWTYAPSGDGPRIFLNSNGGFMAYDLNPVFGEIKERTNTTGRTLAVQPPADVNGESNSWVPGGRPFVDNDSIYIALDPVKNDYDPHPSTTPHEYSTLVPARIAALDRETFQVKWSLDSKYLWPWSSRLGFQKVGDSILYADAGGYLLFQPQDGAILWDTLDQGDNFVSVDGSTHSFSNEESAIFETTTSNGESAKSYPGEDNPSVARLTFLPDQYPSVRSTLVWGLTVPGSEQLQGSPLVHNGVVYVLSYVASLVVDAGTGKLYGRDKTLVTNQNIAMQTTWKYNDLWLVYTADHHLTAVKMNLHVGLDGKLYK